MTDDEAMNIRHLDLSLRAPFLHADGRLEGGEQQHIPNCLCRTWNPYLYEGEDESLRPALVKFWEDNGREPTGEERRRIREALANAKG